MHTKILERSRTALWRFIHATAKSSSSLNTYPIPDFFLKAAIQRDTFSRARKKNLKFLPIQPACSAFRSPGSHTTSKMVPAPQPQGISRARVPRHPSAPQPQAISRARVPRRDVDGRSRPPRQGARPPSPAPQQGAYARAAGVEDGRRGLAR